MVQDNLPTVSSNLDEYIQVERGTINIQQKGSGKNGHQKDDVPMSGGNNYEMVNSMKRSRSDRRFIYHFSQHQKD